MTDSDESAADMEPYDLSITLPVLARMNASIASRIFPRRLSFADTKLREKVVAMADVIHDPRTDWCACEPNAADRCDYRMLADTVIERLNPPDGDSAEVDICESAIANIANYVGSLPCTCTPGGDDEPCGRCAALGQRCRGPVQR